MTYSGFIVSTNNPIHLLLLIPVFITNISAGLFSIERIYSQESIKLPAVKTYNHETPVSGNI
jgi:hypothetical protein